MSDELKKTAATLFALFGIAALSFTRTHAATKHAAQIRGARTFEVVMGLGKDEKNGSFGRDFSRVIDHGFRTCAFPPASRDTTFSIPTGFNGTTRLNPAPSMVDVPDAKTLEEAAAQGPGILLSNVQKTLDSVFVKMGSQDTFVLYLSSHGTDQNGVYRFAMNYTLSYNASSADSEEMAEPFTSIALRDLDFTRCNAGSLVIVADTCYSASMVENMEEALRDHPGKIVLIGSAAETAQDWRGESAQRISLADGVATVPQGGVFTSQFLDALADPTLHGDLYSVMRKATLKASRVTSILSEQVTGNPQPATIWTRPVERMEVGARTGPLAPALPDR